MFFPACVKKWGMILLCLLIVMSLTPITEASSNANYSYLYDSSGRLISARLSDGSVIEYQYDSNGNQVGKETTGNLLINSGFELYRTNCVAEGWRLWNVPGSQVSAEVVQTPVASGKKAQKVEGSKLPTNGGVFLSQDLDIQANKSYIVNGRIFLQSLSNAKVMLYVDFYSNEWISNKAVELKTNPGYLTVSMDGIVPANATKATVSVAIIGTGNGGNGTVYVDSMNLQYDKSNLLINGEMESYTGTDGLADAWRLWNPPGSHAAAEIVQTFVSSGRNAQKLEGSNLPVNEGVFLSQDLAIQASKPYVVNGRIFTQSLNNAKVMLYVDFYSDAWISNKGIELSNTSGYFTASMNGIVPTNATRATVSVAIVGTGSGGSGTVFVDSMNLQYDSSNLLVNSEMERNTSGIGIADGWRLWNVPGSQVAAETVQTPVSSGKKAQKLEGSNLPESGGVFLSQDLAIQSGKPFLVNGRVFTQSLNNAKVMLYVDFYSNEWISNKAVELKGNTGYFTLSMDEVIPSSATIATVSIAIVGTGNGGSGTIYVDSMNLNYGKSNVLINSEMESYTGTSGLADAWRLWNTPGSQIATEVVQAPVSSGRRAQKLEGTNLPANGGVFLSQDLATQAGRPFVLNGKVYFEKRNNAKVLLIVDFASNAWISNKVIELKDPASGYVSLNIDGIVPSNATSATISVAIIGTGNGGMGTAYVDSMSFNYK